jgi:Flp pilus assembly protein TadG
MSVSWSSRCSSEDRHTILWRMVAKRVSRPNGRRWFRMTEERGQVMVLTVVLLVPFLGLGALTVDLGSWYRTGRSLQATADAAALAGAQALPYDPAGASNLASLYATKNGGTIAPGGVSFSQASAPNDSITVSVTGSAPSFFAKVFGINTVTLHAHATAQSDEMAEAMGVAPITVSKDHPMLAGSGCPCFGQATTIPMDRLGSPGAFGLINLDGSKGGNGGPNTLAGWILNGYDGYLPLGDYYSNTGAKFNAAQMQSALTARIGSTLLFPVYSILAGNGSNAQYIVIGWAAFYLTGFDARGNNGNLYGYFTNVTWNGIAASTNTGQPDYGARTIQLVQ